MLVGALLLHQFDVLHDVGEIAILGEAVRGGLPQRLQPSVDAVHALIFGRLDGVRVQHVGQVGLTGFQEVQHTGQDDVRRHAVLLRGATGDAVELGDGELELAGVGHLPFAHPLFQRVKRLHRALAVRGLVTHHDGPAVVLKRRRHDLGSRGAVMTHGDDERTIVAHAGILVLQHVHLLGVADLHDGAALDEEPGQLHRLVEQPATIAAQIKDDAGDLFLLQPRQELFHVGRALLIELRQINHAQALLFPVRRDVVHDAGEGVLLGELDLVADQPYDPALGVADRVHRDNGKPHLGAFFATDHVHDLAELHVEAVHRLGLALSHGDDLVLGLELLAQLSGTARGEIHDLGVALIILPKLGADAVELELHVVDVEILGIRRSHVIRMRVKGMAKCREVNLQNLARIELLHVLLQPRVALGDLLGRLLRLFLCQLAIQELELDPLPPDLRGLGLVLRPRPLVSLGQKFLILGEILLLLEQIGNPGQTRVQPGQIAGVDFKGGLGIGGLGEIVQFGAVFLGELVHV